MLGDYKRSIRLGFNDGITDVRHVRNVLPVHLTVAAGALRAAFHRVAGDGACGELVPLVRLPSEFVQHGAKH